jgi:hypothetical protein|tara:strand:+ start:131 stop:346 length:216 start_codon:yes stop_codon:yes gene_type:complete
MKKIKLQSPIGLLEKEEHVLEYLMEGAFQGLENARECLEEENGNTDEILIYIYSLWEEILIGYEKDYNKEN